MGVIQGTITDQNTGKPIVGAAVIIVDANSNPIGSSTFSDSSGNFYLSDPNLDNTANQVEFNAGGYQQYIVGAAFANNNVSLAPVSSISIATPAGNVTPIVNSAGNVINSVTGTPLVSNSPAAIAPTAIRPAVPATPTTNYTWLWVFLGASALAVAGYFIIRHSAAAKGK